MRLCHFSDSHLGAGESHPRRGESGLTLRQEDIVNSFIQAVDKIIELKPDVCIHAGDLFNSIRPANKILAVAGQQLYRLAVTHRIPTIVIAGNHDSPKQAHVDAALRIYSGIENLHVAANCAFKEILIGDARFVAIPHDNDPVEMKETLEMSRPDSSCRYNVLITHGVAAGMPQFSMAELGETELPVGAMERFDYTALGHYHNFTQVAERVYYAGSTDRLSLSERDAAKGLVEVTLGSFSVMFHELTTRPMIDIQPIDATGLRGDQLADAITQRLSEVGVDEKIARLTITGITPETLKTIPPQFFREIRQSSFALDIRFERASSKKETPQFGRAAIGSLDMEFARYLETANIQGVDRQKLLAEAQQYLSIEE